MKTCPKCGELNGDSADTCFKCGHSFNVSLDDILALNNLYEYDIVTIKDDETGALDLQKLKDELTSHATQGWHLAKTISNELGQNKLGIGGIGINATINQTIIIFERCIAKASR
ncbi:MAG: DUF4177 domain-containing protein [Treponema sp.]|nr:DUF4177 domain-containing protein [Treponema sp.]